MSTIVAGFDFEAFSVRDVFFGKWTDALATSRIR